jgi:hypothetical protein
MTAYPQHRAQYRVPHLLQPYREGWVIERSETVVPLHTAETSKVEVD